MRGWSEHVMVVRQKALTVGGAQLITDELAVGNGWHVLRLRINEIVVIGTGTGPITEGELLFIKRVLLTTDKGEIICNLSGRALYKIATFKNGTPPRKDAIAAATATYRVNLPIYFSESKGMNFKRPNDTILDTKRYSSVKLEVTLGTVADLFTTVGTSSVTCTGDVEIYQTKGILPKEAQPVGYMEYDQMQPVDASVQTNIFLKRAQDYYLKRLYVFSGTSGQVGNPWSGTASDAIQDYSYIEDQTGFLTKERIHAFIQDDNKDQVSLETIVTGLEVHDFVKGESLREALWTVGKTLLQYRWVNQGAPGANTIMSAATEAMRPIPPY